MNPTIVITLLNTAIGIILTGLLTSLASLGPNVAYSYHYAHINGYHTNSNG